MKKAQIESGTVYWQHPSGEVMLAPDTRMKPFKGWQRVECKTTGEVERFSRRMAIQEFQKFRSMRVEEHLRSRDKREQLKANCRLRLAQGCISTEDERLTRQTLASLERKDEAFYKMLVDEPDLTRASLVIERKEEAIGLAQFSGKRKGLADTELNSMAKLAEQTA